MNHNFRINLPSLGSTLRAYELQPRKGMGQNFLLNSARLAQIARCPGSLENKTVIEVGPGPGGLTRALLEAGAKKVIAIELDERCLPILQQVRACAPDRLVIYHDDVMELDIGSLCRDSSPENTLIIANLPYHISVPLLIKWLKQASLFSGFFLMFQKEVADRLVALPGTKDYGRLSVIVQWACHVKKRLLLSPQEFIPSPRVFSAFVQLIPQDHDGSLWDKMEQILSCAFQKRRKMLRSSLKDIWPDPEAILKSLGICSSRRAETLSVTEFLKLAQTFQVVKKSN